MNKKGVILVLSLVVMTVLLILTGVYFSGLITEKKAADTEEFVLQALNLAEAGSAHALQELKKRTGADLTTAIEAASSTTVSNNLKNLFSGQNPLGLLSGYGQFAVSNGQATFSPALTPLGLQTGVQGSYNAAVTIVPDPDPDPTHPNPDANPTNPSTDEYLFYYKYSIESRGEVTRTTPRISKTIDLLEGKFTISVRRDNFAKYALFTSHHGAPSGTTVWFTENTNFTGPVHTNTHFSFANNPSGHFTEIVTQHEKKAEFYHSPKLLDADSYPPYDVPIFDKGFQRGYDEIVLPSTVSQADLKKEALGTMSEPGSNGIYVPNDGTNLTGGIYVRGNSTVNMGIDVNNNPVYTITQGSTTKTVTVDYISNQTKVQAGLVTDTYQGVPDGVTETGGVLIYAKDDITGFSGTVQKDSSVTVSSERDIVITNNVQYQQYNSGPPLNAEGYTNLLGILSWGGNVRIGTSAPNNIQIHGVVMAPHGVFTVDNYNVGSPRGTATLLGGAITDFYGPFGTFSGTTQRSGYGRNFVYDARMLEGRAPLYFPYMANYTSNVSPSDAFLSEKLIWQEGKGS